MKGFLDTLLHGEPVKIAPRTRIKLAAWGLLATLVAWPVTSFTIFASKAVEWHAVLGLSWLAITVTCVDILCTTDVRANQEGE